MDKTTENKKQNRAKKVLIIIISVLLGLSILLFSTYGLLYYIGNMQFHQGDTNISLPSGFEDDEIEIDENEVIYKGKSYYLNENIATILCMGIDKKNINENLGYGKNGQADCIFVVAIDTKTKKITIIPISRETMVDVNEYSVDGEFLGAEKQQICLAYSYGNSNESSAQNVKTSVSRALYGINISTYVTVNLDAISTITTAMGGIKLTSIEDFTIRDKVVKSGQQLTLKGTEAVDYIQARGEDVNANNRRMLRQKQFLTTLLSQAGNDVLSDFSKLTEYYNLVKPYTSSDLSFSQLTYLASNCLSKNIGDSIEFKSPSGTMEFGKNGWAEFTPDSDEMLDIIMSVFYTEKSK